MPIFTPLLPERIEELTRRRQAGVVVDLSDYKNWIEQAKQESSGWGEIVLEPGDNVRAIKRRTTIAGKELHLAVRWNRRSDAHALLFQAVDPGSIKRRPRRRPEASSVD